MEREIYQTSDIGLAATLLTIGCDVKGINPTDPRRIIFIFDVDVAEKAEDYWNGNLLVNPKEVFNNRSDLLSRVKEAQRSLYD